MGRFLLIPALWLAFGLAMGLVGAVSVWALLGRPLPPEAVASLVLFWAVGVPSARWIFDKLLKLLASENNSR